MLAHILEPEGRNTAAAAAAAAAFVQARDPRGILLVLLGRSSYRRCRGIPPCGRSRRATGARRQTRHFRHRAVGTRNRLWLYQARRRRSATDRVMRWLALSRSRTEPRRKPVSPRAAMTGMPASSCSAPTACLRRCGRIVPRSRARRRSGGQGIARPRFPAPRCRGVRRLSVGFDRLCGDGADCRGGRHPRRYGLERYRLMGRVVENRRKGRGGQCHGRRCDRRGDSGTAISVPRLGLSRRSALKISLSSKPATVLLVASRDRVQDVKKIVAADCRTPGGASTAPIAAFTGPGVFMKASTPGSDTRSSI